MLQGTGLYQQQYPTGQPIKQADQSSAYPTAISQPQYQLTTQKTSQPVASFANAQYVQQPSQYQFAPQQTQYGTQSQPQYNLGAPQQQTTAQNNYIQQPAQNGASQPNIYFQPKPDSAQTWNIQNNANPAMPQPTLISQPQAAPQLQQQQQQTYSQFPNQIQYTPPQQQGYPPQGQPQPGYGEMYMNQGQQKNDDMWGDAPRGRGRDWGEPLSPNQQATNTLFVDGLPSDVNKRELSHVFRPFKGFREARIVIKDSKKVPGDKVVLGFVEFDNANEATVAFDKMNEYIFDEDKGPYTRIRISYSNRPSTNRGNNQRGGGGNRGGSRDRGRSNGNRGGGDRRGSGGGGGGGNRGGGGGDRRGRGGFGDRRGSDGVNKPRGDSFGGRNRGGGGGGRDRRDNGQRRDGGGGGSGNKMGNRGGKGGFGGPSGGRGGGGTRWAPQEEQQGAQPTIQGLTEANSLM